MNKIEKLLEKHFTKLGCKCDVMDNTKQYQASLNAINEALTLYGVVASLPSKEVINFEYKTLKQLSDESGLPICEKSMKSGFEYCYNVIKKLQENNN